MRNAHNRLRALEARLPVAGDSDDAAALTPAQQDELAHRVAAIAAATGDDLNLVLQRSAEARTGADKTAVLGICTNRELLLLIALWGGESERPTDGRLRGCFTERESAAVVALYDTWGVL